MAFRFENQVLFIAEQTQQNWNYPVLSFNIYKIGISFHKHTCFSVLF